MKDFEREKLKALRAALQAAQVAATAARVSVEMDYMSGLVSDYIENALSEVDPHQRAPKGCVE